MKSLVAILFVFLTPALSLATPYVACQVQILAFASQALHEAYPEQVGTFGEIREITFNLTDRLPKVVFFGDGIGDKRYCLAQVLMKKPESWTPCPQMEIDHFDLNCP